MNPQIPCSELERLLFDDAPQGDLTSKSLGLADRSGRMVFSARNAMVAALTAEAAAILEMAGARVALGVENGQALAPEPRFFRARPCRRVAARLESRADADRNLVRSRHVRTRNRGRGARRRAGHLRRLHPEKHARRERFAVAAVKAGGAVMHRLGLSETILVFPEHRAFLAGESLSDIAARLRRAAPEKKLVIEVGNVEDGWPPRRPVST